MKTLNKILCAMWGHVYVEHSGTVFIRVQSEVYEHIVRVAKCKHCAARKND